MRELMVCSSQYIIYLLHLPIKSVDKPYTGVRNPLPTLDQLDGFNVFILSFLMVDGPSDEVSAFVELDSDTRESTISEYHSNGISLMVSAFGADDAPTSNGADPIDTANMIADFVLNYGVSSSALTDRCT
jgi:hypothetical protein